MNEPAPSHRPQLDGLRCFAVLGVIVSHAGGNLNLPGIGAVSTGPLGVQLFFVLSGFLITGILLDCRVSSDAGEESRGFLIRRFYMRRFLRIFPLYYAVLLVLVAVSSQARTLAPWLFTYTSNLYIAGQKGWPGHLSHLWSLAVEEQFYLVWPFLILLLPRRAVLPAVVAVIATGPLYRLYAFQRYGDEMRHVFTLAVVDSLGVGALGAIAVRSCAAETFRTWLGRLAPLGLLAWCVTKALHTEAIHAGPRHVLGASFLAVPFAWLVLGAARGFRGWGGALLSSPPLVYVGKISYGVYVFHCLLIPVIARAGAPFGIRYHPSGPLGVLVVTAVTIPVAAASWHLFERPILALKDRFEYRRSATTPSPEGTQNRLPRLEAPRIGPGSR